MMTAQMVFVPAVFVAQAAKYGRAPVAPVGVNKAYVHQDGAIHKASK